MKKKFVCQLLALSMTAVMAVPQAGLPVFAASAANTQQAQLKEEAKVGTEITQLEGSTSWMTGTLEKIVLSEITSDSAYCKAITGISVNGVDYVADWNEEDDTLVYSAGWLGMTIYSGAFKEGENTIVIKADGYLDKTILFTKAENECTFVSQSDGNGGQEPEVLDKTALTEKLEEAKALIQGDKSDEEWEDLQSAITAAEHTLRVATTQASLNTALEDLTKAMEKFTTGLTAPTVTAVAYDGNELTIEEINLGIISKLKEDAGIHSKVIELVLNEVAEAIKAGGEDLQIYTSGATNIFRYPELAEGEKASKLIGTLEQKEVLQEFVSDVNADQQGDGGIQVYIGDETPIQSMKDCSVVTANYDLGGGLRGTVGIIGPKRMDYEKVLGTLKNLMNQLDAAFKKDER